MSRSSKHPKDPRGKHVRLYIEMLKSPAWLSITPMDRTVYQALRAGLGPANNGDLSLPLTVARDFGVGSQTTLAKGLRACCAVGLIAVTRPSSRDRAGQWLATLYRLTDEPSYPMTKRQSGMDFHIEGHRIPTNEWKAVRTVERGLSLIAAAEAAARQQARTTKTTAKLAEVSGHSEIENPCPESGGACVQYLDSVAPFLRPESGLGEAFCVQNLDSVKSGDLPEKTLRINDLGASHVH